MRFILTALIFLAGLFDLFLALTFLIGPADAGRGLGVAAIAQIGTSTIRADFTSFFGVAAFCMMWGAWRRNGDLLLVPTLLFGVSFLGRAVDLAVSGAYPGWPFAMTVEAFHVVLLGTAWRLLPHHRIEEIAG
ncbi:hypothetical protein [Novosphingobium sp.]|uniref:hypothetical protein n=1 Tax=Novosphingobium sp. TaxID=1874826 RepID=UPI0038B850BB